MDEKGQNKPNEIRTKPDVFYLNPKSEYFLSRIKKIVFASYMVSDLIKDTESLKSNIRNIADGLLKDSCLLYKNRFQTIKENLLVLKTFFELGLVSKLVSVMNAEIMIKEISRTLEELAIEEQEESKRMTLENETFFISQLPENKNEINNLNNLYPYADSSKGDLLRTEYKGQNSNVFYKHDKSYTKKIFSEKDKFNIKDKNQSSKKSLNNEREDRIISIIKDRKEVTIKDISALIKDCSEKTIQRDLIQMLEKGVIKKTGERRWSKYSI